MILDMSDAFDGLESTIDVITQSVGSYVNGRWVAGTDVPGNIIGVLQNTTPEDLKILPEGDRTVEAIKIHTLSTLTVKDTIQYQGSSWRIFNIATRAIGNYNKVLAMREDR